MPGHANNNTNTRDVLHLRLLGRALSYPGRRLGGVLSGVIRGTGTGTSGRDRSGSSKLGSMRGHDKKGFKLVLLGRSGVGKSSILHRWINGRWLGEHGGNMSTIGAAFSTTHFEFRGDADKHIAPCKQKVDIWDTAGQERYRGMLALYYRGADLGLLVSDLTERPEDIEQGLRDWIREYREKSDNLNLLLIGNKTDLVRVTEDQDLEMVPGVRKLRALGQKFDLPVVLVSALTNDGIEQMMSLISEQVWAKLVRYHQASKVPDPGAKTEDGETEEDYFLGEEEVDARSDLGLGSSSMARSRCF